MAEIRFELNDGTTLDVDPSAPFTAREQIAWEEHFGGSFTEVFRAINNDLAALRAGTSPSGIVQSYRVSWVLWFGWYRLRPKVANRFATFVDDQMRDWNWIVPPAPAEAPAADTADTEVSENAGSVDPTGPPPASTPDLLPTP